MVNHKRVGQGAVGKATKVRVRARRRIATEAANITIEAIDNDGNPNANPVVNPNGQDIIRIKATVVDSSGVPISNHRLRFKVEAREVDVQIGSGDGGIISLTPNQRNNTTEARRALRQAYISTGASGDTANRVSNVFRPTGMVNIPNTRTGNSGTAIVRYRAPRVGGNQEQPAVEVVKVTSASNARLTAECRIELSFNLFELTAQRGFRIVGAFGTYATQNARDNIVRAGEAWSNAILAARRNAPGSNRDLADQTIPEEFTIKALSLRHGGVYPPHVTHRNGLNMDLRPINAGGVAGQWQNNPSYKRAATAALVGILRQNGTRRILFNDLQIPDVNAAPGHDNHLHVEF